MKISEGSSQVAQVNANVIAAENAAKAQAATLNTHQTGTTYYNQQTGAWQATPTPQVIERAEQIMSQRSADNRNTNLIHGERADRQEARQMAIAAKSQVQARPKTSFADLAFGRSASAQSAVTLPTNYYATREDQRQRGVYGFTGKAENIGGTWYTKDTAGAWVKMDAGNPEVATGDTLSQLDAIASANMDSKPTPTPTPVQEKKAIVKNFNDSRTVGDMIDGGIPGMIVKGKNGNEAIIFEGTGYRMTSDYSDFNDDIPMRTPMGRNVQIGYYDPQKGIVEKANPYGGYSYDQLKSMYGEKAANFIRARGLEAGGDNATKTGYITKADVMFTDLDKKVGDALQMSRTATNMVESGRAVREYAAKNNPIGSKGVGELQEYKPKSITDQAVDIYTSVFPSTVLTEVLFPNRYKSKFPTGTDIARPPAGAIINPDPWGRVTKPFIMPSNATETQKADMDQWMNAATDFNMIVGLSGLGAGDTVGLGRGFSWTKAIGGIETSAGKVGDIVTKVPGVKATGAAVNFVSTKANRAYDFMDELVSGPYEAGKGAIRKAQVKSQAEALRRDRFLEEVAQANKRAETKDSMDAVLQALEENPNLGYESRRNVYPSLTKTPDYDELIKVTTKPATTVEIEDYAMGSGNSISRVKKSGIVWPISPKYSPKEIIEANIGGNPTLEERVPLGWGGHDIQQQLEVRPRVTRTTRTRSEFSLGDDENYSPFSELGDYEFSPTIKTVRRGPLTAMPAVASTFRITLGTNQGRGPKFNPGTSSRSIDKIIEDSASFQGGVLDSGTRQKQSTILRNMLGTGTKTSTKTTTKTDTVTRTVTTPKPIERIVSMPVMRTPKYNRPITPRIKIPDLDGGSSSKSEKHGKSKSIKFNNPTDRWMDDLIGGKFKKSRRKK